MFQYVSEGAFFFYRFHEQTRYFLPVSEHEISGEAIFIDGTKIEACANKYTFVWKKAFTKNQAKLLVKIADLIAECEQLYDLRIVHGDTVKIKHVKRLRKKLSQIKQLI